MDDFPNVCDENEPDLPPPEGWPEPETETDHV